MPRIKLDLREAQSFSAIPDDMYLVKVSEVRAAAKGENSTYVPVVFEVTEGPTDEFVGRKLFRNFPITGKGAGFFAELWEKVTGEEIDMDSEELDVDTDDLLGGELCVVTKQREYPPGSGTMSSEIKRMMKAAAFHQQQEEEEEEELEV